MRPYHPLFVTADSHSAVGSVIRATTRIQGRQSRVLVLWDVDDTLLCNDRSSWLADPVTWEQTCLNDTLHKNITTYHLLLSAGTTGDVFHGPLSSYRERFGVPDWIGCRLCHLPGQPLCSFTLQGIQGISINPCSHASTDPGELYLNSTKLEIMLALVGRSDCFDHVLFVDNSLYELGLLNGGFHATSAWLRSRGAGDRVRMIHLRLGETHAVLPTADGMVGLPYLAYIGLLDRGLRTPPTCYTPTLRSDIPREVNCQVALALLLHQITKSKSLRTMITILFRDKGVVDHHMRCRLLLLMRVGVDVVEVQRQFRERMEMLLQYTVLPKEKRVTRQDGSRVWL